MLLQGRSNAPSRKRRRDEVDADPEEQQQRLADVEKSVEGIEKQLNAHDRFIRRFSLRIYNIPRVNFVAYSASLLSILLFIVYSV